MSACWPLQMPPTQKSVLISLADNANDHGECWPSIAKIAERTCFSERAVQNAIKWLEAEQVVLADRSNGRHTRYMLVPDNYIGENPRSKFIPTDARTAPPQQMHPAGGASVPPQEVRQPPQEVRQPPQEVPSNRKEPSRTVRSNRKTEPTPAELLFGLPEKLISDFLKVRKAKRLPLTETAVDGLKREADKSGLTLEAAVRMCCERGWGGFKAEWLAREAAKPHVAAEEPKPRPRLTA